MKKVLKFLGNITLAAVIGFSMLSCPTDGGGDKQQPGDEGKPDIILVNISEETEWDWFAAAIDGSCMVFNVDETTGLPTRLFLKPYKDSDDGFSYTFKENGLVDTMVNNGLVFVFDNFNGYTFDYAVIYPDDTIEVHFGIQTEVDWDTYDEIFMSVVGRSVGARSALELTGNYLEAIGHMIGIVTCVTAITNPGSASGCLIYLGSYIAKTTIKILDEGFDVLGDLTTASSNLTIDGINLIIDSIGCAGKDVKDCISVVTGLASMLIDGDYQVVIEKVKQIYQAKEEMKPYPMTVNFHANGGIGTVPASITIETGDSDYVTLPSGDGLSRDGYFFIGWSTSPNGPHYHADYLFEVKGNISFYARWRENLPAPTGLTAAAGSSDSITLSWNSVSDESEYRVYRSTSASGTYSQVGTSHSTIYLDDGLSASTAYYYKVSYYRSNYGESLLSDSVSAVTMAPGEGISVTFTGLTANGGVLTNTTELTLTFSAAITGLSAADITLADVEGIQKGTLSGSGPTYTLGVSGFTAGGTLSVSVQKAGYNIHESVQSTTVHYCEQGKGIGTYEMVYVEGGTFQLGKALGTPGTYKTDSTPVSNVTLSGFYIGKYEVTQSQWQAVMGTTLQEQYIKNSAAGWNWNDRYSNYGRGYVYPMYCINWYEAVEFCNALSVLEGLTPYYTVNKEQTDPNNTSNNDTLKWLVTPNTNANGYRLPTDAEWEYAAKGGNQLAPGWVGYTYSGSNTLDDVAWHYGNSWTRTGSSYDYAASHAVGTKAPNGLGIYDMSGNVEELCWDWYNNFYPAEAQVNPTGPSSGYSHVRRGGHNSDSATSYFSCIGRKSETQGSSFGGSVFGSGIGFRVVRSGD